VLFADDDVARQSYSPSRSKSCSPTRSHASAQSSPSSSPHRNHSVHHTTFEDFLPPHLINTSLTAAPVKNLKTRWIPSPISSPSSSPESLPSPLDSLKDKEEKWEHSTSPIDTLPELPLKISDSAAAASGGKGGVVGRALTLRSCTGRVLGRTLEAVKGHRLLGRQRDGGEGWVIV
jgi:hypothetical protein